MKHNLNWENIRTREEGVTILNVTWDSLPQVWNRDTRQFISERLKMVKDSNGISIQHMLSAHKSKVPEGYAPINVNQKPWFIEDDQLLEI